MNDVYFSPEFVATLRQQMQMSDSTWHKVMNPLCGQCAMERGQQVAEQFKAGTYRKIAENANA